VVIEKISLAEYARIFQKPMHIYISVPFNDTVRLKCEECFCLLMHENKVKIGLMGGIQGKAFLSPYSAPFGGFSFLDDEVKLSSIINAIDLVETYMRGAGLNKILYTLPPYFYNEGLLSKTYFAFTYKKYDFTTEINYHFNSTDLVKYDTGVIDRSTKNNLRRAEKAGLSFRKVIDDIDKLRAYSIIKRNKAGKNRPMNMAFEALIITSRIVEVDFFLVTALDKAIASAIIYHVAPQIVQIIYWGNLPESIAFRPMNYLAYNLFKYYSGQNIRFVDLGISSEKGAPNFGLCDFKENIGCTPSVKFTFTRLLSGIENNRNSVPGNISTNDV
jgi:hypothetical protein